MMKLALCCLASAALLAGCHSQTDRPAVETEVSLMSWSDLTSRPLPAPTSRHEYGDHEAQFAELWLPESSGPHPVVFMVHGGCWQKSIADRSLMNYAAEDLRTRGLAVWNIEYRGVDEEGGGYPGTFTDVRDAAEALFELGPSLDLDTTQVAAFGHSAGGHLAAWVAVQSNLPENSEIEPGSALPISSVIVSGGLADLEASLPVTLETCLANIVENLTGPASADRPDVYSDTSVSKLLPTSSELISVNGAQDRIAPPKLGRALTNLVVASGAKGQFVEVPETGHVELIAPGTAAFEIQARLLENALNPSE